MDSCLSAIFLRNRWVYPCSGIPYLLAFGYMRLLLVEHRVQLRGDFREDDCRVFAARAERRPRVDFTVELVLNLPVHLVADRQLASWRRADKGIDVVTRDRLGEGGRRRRDQSGTPTAALLAAEDFLRGFVSGSGRGQRFGLIGMRRLYLLMPKPSISSGSPRCPDRARVAQSMSVTCLTNGICHGPKSGYMATLAAQEPIEHVLPGRFDGGRRIVHICRTH